MNGLNAFYARAYAWLLAYGPKILMAIILLIVGQWVISVTRRWVQRFFLAPRFKAFRPFLNGLLNLAMQVLLILLIMQILGIQMTIFAAVIASFGVAAGFALAGTLQNFASGVLILILKPYKMGDNIITQNQEGTVTSIQLFYTVVTTFDNKTVIVPNSKLSNEIIVNLSKQGNRRIDIDLKFAYAVDFSVVKNLITEAIGNMKNTLGDPPLRIGITKLDDGTYTVTVNIWAKVHGFLDTTMAVNEVILNKFKEAGIK